MKHELLVPAGDVESLNQAIANGADAVYVGCKNFGARKFAKNFENDEIVTAIKLCHLYGVKLYVTMNTLIKDAEVPEFLGQIEFLYKAGIDAVLIQDFGMLCLVREKYPDLEVHASTQANTSSKDTAALYHKLGVKRVVFSREMSLDEIKKVDVPIEKEVFIHGALCISYSGCCLMSSMLGGRSGNRGECAGCCRLPYTLEKGQRVMAKDRYLLSTKELNTSYRFEELLDSDITSFKIEGRMKSPEYVGFITKFYRSLIDSHCKNVDIDGLNKQLKKIFNRGFTEGYLFNTDPVELMNNDTPNHIGLEIGRVVEASPKFIKIELTEELNQQDGIRFLNNGNGFIVNYLYGADGKLVNSAPAGSICFVDNKVELTTTDVVCKTQDYKLMTSLKQLPIRRIPVTIQVKAKLSEPLEIIMSDGTYTFMVQGNPVQASQNAPMSKQRIREQVEKLGETPFTSTTTIVEADSNIFIPVKEINELRRSLTEQLVQSRMQVKREFKVQDVVIDVPDTKLEPAITASAFTMEQVDACNKYKLKRIYAMDHEVSKEYDNDRIYYVPTRNSRTPLSGYKKRALVSEYFDFSLKEYLVGDYGLNVTNVYTAYYIYKLTMQTVTLSVELTNEELINFINDYIKTFNKYPNVEILAYGRVENMVIKGNILKLSTKVYDYKLRDNKGRVFPVYFDGVNTHVLNYEQVKLDDIKLLKKYASLRLDFYDEEPDKIKSIINEYLMY